MRRSAGLALLALLAVPTSAPAAADLREDPCFRDRELRVGAAPASAFYSTVSPFEHFSADRSQTFPHTCSLRELGGPGDVPIRARQSTVSFQTPYIASTRERGELYVYGYGGDAATEGGFVASVDPATLGERWRTRITDPKPRGQWSYPGVLLVHGNGFVYAVYGNVLVKLDAATGEVVARAELPEDPSQSGAAYNGMIVMPDGRIVAKKIERGPCPTSVTPEGPVAPAEALAGLLCANANELPSLLVVVEPDDLRVLSTLEAPEPITGRITTGRLDGRDFVYAAGKDTLRRFEYADGRLALDDGWGPVPYRAGGEQPGTGPGILGEFLVVQTNFLPSSEPMTLTAVSLRDSRRVFRAKPFAASGSRSSFIVSKAALDTANRTVVTHDTAAGQMAAYRLDPRRGFVLRWRRELRSLNFSALVGPPSEREIVISDLAGEREQVVWLDLETGRERARSGTLANAPAPGNIVTPGFRGRFYYVSSRGVLWELRPDTSGRDAVPPRVAVSVVRRGCRLRLKLSEPAAVRLRGVVRRRLRARAGVRRIALRRCLRRGRHRVSVLARDRSGNPTRRSFMLRGG